MTPPPPSPTRHRLCSGLDWNQPSLHHNSPYNQNTAARNDLTGFRTFRPSRLSQSPRPPVSPPRTREETLTRWWMNRGDVKIAR